MSLNTVTLMGRLTASPELRTTETGTPVTSFTLAVNRDYQRDITDFFPCVAWRKTAEFAAKYFGKGSLAAVVGMLQNRRWTDRDGNNRTTTEIVVSNIYFAESKHAQSGETGALTSADFEPVSGEDDGLPF